MENLKHSVILGLAYFMGAWVGVHLTSIDGGIAILWPPNAILLAALLAFPVSRWPSFIVAVFIAEICADISVFTLTQAMLFACINTLECVAVVGLLHYLYSRSGTGSFWERPDGVVAFLVIVLALTTPIAALAGASVNYYLVGKEAEFITLWKLWWFGDATGLVALTPFVYGLLKGQRVRLSSEFLGICLLSSVMWLALLMTKNNVFVNLAVAPMALCLPIIWCAMRVGRYETVVLATIIGIATVISSSAGVGVFSDESFYESVILTQEFIIIFLSLAYLCAAFAAQLVAQAQQLKIYKKCLESISEGLVITEAGGDQEIIFCNPAFEEMSGYASEEILGKNCRFLNTQHRDQPALDILREGIKSYTSVETTLLNTRSDGTEFWNKVSVVPVEASDGSTQFFCGVQQDVTVEIQRAQELESLVAERTLELDTERERFTLASRVSGLGVWEWNINTGELIWDERMHQIYETTEEDRSSNLVYELWERAVHPDDVEDAAATLADAVERKCSWQYEFRLKMPDGRTKYISATAVFYQSKDGKTQKMIGGNIDVTKQKELEKRLRQAVAEAESSNLAKSQFLANMSHEIRTPMNGVLGISELMLGTLLTAQQQEYLSMIQSSANLLLRILNDVLDLSKIESGKMKLETEVFELEEYIGDLVKGFAVNAHAKELELHYYFSPEVPKWIESDPTRIGQIIFNLLGNAIKFTEAGEVKVLVKMTPRDEHDNSLQIVVQDTGIGIPSKMKNEIFKPFLQADGSITRKYGGTGLGLTIVTELVKLMSGSIDVESVPQQGTRFIVTLPFKPAVDEGSSKRTSEPAKLMKIVRYIQHCLIVDDNPTNQRWLQDMVNGWGGDASVAASAEEAVDLIAQSERNGTPYKIMLLDKNMPVKSGFDLLEMLKTKGLDTPKVVIMLSSSNPSGDVEKAKSLGVNHYLLKPVKQSEVYDTLIDLIEGYRQGATSEKSASDREEITATDKPLNILVAEDNAVNQRILKDILEGRAHKVTIVDNGKLAVDTVREKAFDVILMDVQMPTMGGIEATEVIRRMEQQNGLQRNRIIALTAHALKGDREKCLAAGMDDYLTKPVFADKLLKMIEQHEAPPSTLVKPDAPSESSGRVGLSAQSQAWQFFDYQKSLLTTGGKDELVAAVVQMTLEHAPVIGDKISASIASQDFARAGESVHKLKGMLSSLCHDDLLESLDSLELELEESKTAELWEGIELQLSGLYHELKKLIGGDTDENSDRG